MDDRNSLVQGKVPIIGAPLNLTEATGVSSFRQADQPPTTVMVTFSANKLEAWQPGSEYRLIEPFPETIWRASIGEALAPAAMRAARAVVARCMMLMLNESLAALLRWCMESTTALFFLSFGLRGSITS